MLENEILISNIRNQYNPNFCSIKLSAKEAEKAEIYLHKLADSGLNIKEKQVFKNYLFGIFDKHLQTEAYTKAKGSHIFKEVLSEMYLKFSELLYDIKSNQTPDTIINDLNDYKPSKDTLKSEYIHQSLDENVYWDKDLLKRVDCITTKDLPAPKSSEYLDKIRARILKAVEHENISPIIKSRIESRLKGVKYRQISESDNISRTSAQRSVSKGVLKIQYGNDNIPKLYKEKAKIISDLLNCTENEIIKAGLKNPSIFSMKPETITQNVKELCSNFNCEEQKWVKIGLKYPDLLLQKPETLMNNVKESSTLLNCRERDFIKTCFKLPSLFYLKPESLYKHVQETSKMLNCTEQEYIRASLRQPQLLCQKPETLIKNVRETSKKLECSEAEFIKAAIVEPALFCFKPETVAKYFKEAVNYLNCSEKDFLTAALKYPKLFIIKPDTLIKNTNSATQNLNLIKPEFVKIALTKPYLFCVNSESLIKKLKVENYYRKIKNEELKKYPNKDSEQVVYKRIIAFLIQKSNIEGTETFVRTKKDFDLNEFVKTFADREFSFEIPQDEVAEDFIKFVQETSIKTIGKNIFEFKIMEKNPQC